MSKNIKPEGWHEFVSGYELEYSTNDFCKICHGMETWACHKKCAECGDYDIHLICGASCGEARCKKHAAGHWCKSQEEDYGDRRMKCGLPMRL